MNISDLALGALVGVLVSVIVWNLWGIHYLERQWRKAFGEKKRPSVKELLDEENDKQ